MVSFSRRAFLVANALGATSPWTRRHPNASVSPNGRQLPGTADGHFSSPMDPETLRDLAEVAVDTANHGRVTFADVRIGERHVFEISVVKLDVGASVEMWSTLSYGIRVLIDGVWGFAYGAVPTRDAVTTITRNVVASVHGLTRAFRDAPGRNDRLDWGSMSPVKGEWKTPIHIDPFTVPLDNQAALLSACNHAVARVVGGQTNAALRWSRETRVYASTEGSLLTQQLYSAEPSIVAGGTRGLGNVILKVPSMMPQAGGYETVLVPDLQEQLRATTEEAMIFARLPHEPVDVGRYPVVLDGYSFGMMLGSTVGCAAELDRALGVDPTVSGGSFLGPPTTTLGTQVSTPLLTVNAGGSFPAFGARQWDDEGVKPEPYAVIADGRLVDYHTSRATVSALHTWYATQGKPLRSHGCVISPEAGTPALVRTPHLTVVPNQRATTIEECVREVRRGILIRQATFVATDQQYASGTLTNALMLVIDRGRVVRRAFRNGMQFDTGRLLKAVRGIGDASTVRTNTVWSNKGQPWHTSVHAVTAPATLIGEANIIAVGRRR